MKTNNRSKRNNNPSFLSKKGSAKVSLFAAVTAILLIAFAGGTLAFLTDSVAPIKNFFSKGLEYTLIYDDNVEGQNITVPEDQVEYGDGTNPVNFTVSSDKPIRSEFVFTGWNTKVDGSGDTYKGEDTLTPPVDQRKTTLYAQWEAGYTLIYDVNGGSGAPEITQNPDETIDGNTVSVVTDATSYDFTNLAKQGEMVGPEEADGTSDHRVFLGWALDPEAKEPEYTSDGKLAYDNAAGDYDKTKVDGFLDKAEVTEGTTDPVTGNKKTIRLYAVWATKYILDFQYHPDMLAISDPACGTVLPKTQTLVSTKAEHTFVLPEETDENRPTRSDGYTWGWWGDNLNRFGYVETLPTSAPVNEGCYLFDEPIKPLKKDAPTQTLYAYFQPPKEATVLFDKNTSWMTSSIYYSYGRDRDGTVYPMPNPCYGYTNEHEYIPWENGVPTTIPKHSVEYNDNTYNDRYVFKGWAYTPDAKEPDVMPGQKDFSINMVLNNKVTLYAVWESGHNYRLIFDSNASSSSYRRVYYKKAEKESDGSWKFSWANNQNTSGDNRVWFSSDEWQNKDVYRTTPFEYFDETSYTWSKDFFKDRGVFATRSDDSVGTYKFLGWSYEQQEPSVNPETLTVDFPVEIPGPQDKENPNPLNPDLDSITGTIGCITKDVTFDEPNATCTTPITHPVTLYAVWQKSPKHQLALVFNKGGASNNLSYREYYDPSSSGYVASVDLTERKWTASDLSRLTVPTKNPDDTATYEFIGWTKKNTTELPGGIGTEEDVVINVDQTTKKINQDVIVKEPKENPRECEGGRHTDNYYPVFKKTARHKFMVSYDVNAPIEGSTIETVLHQSEDGNSWTHKKVVKSRPGTDQILDKGLMEEEYADLSVTEYKYDLMGKGMYATCENTSPRATSEYTFLGWSYVKYDLGAWNETEHGPLDFPVAVPEDPENPEGKGLLDSDVIIKEEDEEQQCSVEDNEGYVHERTLYGVWAGEPLHQFSLVFVGGPDATVEYGSSDDWENNTTKTSNATVSAGTIDFKGTGLEKEGTGELSRNLLNTWQIFSDTLPMPADEGDPNYSKTFDFDRDFWSEKGIIVKATRKDSNNTRYEFNGWSTLPDQEEGNIDIDDTTELITETVTATDSDYPKCKSETHHAVLYAAWKPIKIHNYQVVFYANGGNEIGRYNDAGTWQSNSSSYTPGYSYSLRKSDVVGIMNPDSVPNTMYYTVCVASAKDPVTTYTSHEWKTTDPDAKRLRVEARRANGTESGKKYKYTFAGWAESPDGTVKYHVDSKSFLTEDIRIEAPHGTNEDDCENYTHTKVLYAVWNKEEIPPEPPRHRFVLSFNLNGGTRFRVYNDESGAWEDKSSIPSIYEPEDESYELSSIKDTYTWPVSTWTDKGLGGARRDPDTYWNYEFVGWSTSQVSPSENPDMSKAIAWSHDPNSTEPGDGFITDSDVFMDCSGSDRQDEKANHTRTLHAIWKRTPRTKSYNLIFDGNSDTAEGIPANIENAIETYDGTSKWNKHNFDLRDTEDPTNLGLIFAGWSEEKNASSGQYGNPYPGEDEDRKKMTEHLNPDFTTEPALNNNVYESTKTLYAIWLYEYKLEYKANGEGAMNAPPHMHAYDKAAQKTTRLRDAVPSWEGHKFLGWATEPDATEPKYQPNDQITIHDNGEMDGYDSIGKAEVILYAVWEEETPSQDPQP